MPLSHNPQKIKQSKFVQNYKKKQDYYAVWLKNSIAILLLKFHNMKSGYIERKVVIRPNNIRKHDPPTLVSSHKKRPIVSQFIGLVTTLRYVFKLHEYPAKTDK